MKPFSPREAVLMLAPVAVLGIFGWLLSARKPAVVAPVGPFKPFVRRVQVLPASASDVFDGYDTRVVVEFDAHGRAPAWWNTGFTYHRFQDTSQIVAVQQGKSVFLRKASLSSTPDLDPVSKRWITTYKLKLRDIPAQSGPLRLRDSVKFINNSEKELHKLWLDAPIRADGVATKLPDISRVPCATIESFSLDPTPPVEANVETTSYRSEMFRIRLALLKNIPRAGAEKDTDNISANLSIVDGQGKQVGSLWGQSQSKPEGIWYLTSFCRNAAPARYGFPRVTSDPRRWLVGGDSSVDSEAIPTKKRGPLTLQGSIYCGDKWPLAVKIPLRDAVGKMLFSPRTLNVPFRVLSVKQVVASAQESKSSGADCAISVKLQAWNPKADVSKWHWEADYSQRISNAHGGIFWDFPFTSGQNPISPSMKWEARHNRVELRYPLVLKSIGPAEGKLVFHADIAANQSRRVPIEVTVRP